MINCKGRFVSAERLAQLPPGVQGYFLMQEDMKDFVTSSPAAGALFTIIMGDLSDFSVVAFREKLEKYADGGGDGGLTRATVRYACGLPAEEAAPLAPIPRQVLRTCHAMRLSVLCVSRPMESNLWNPGAFHTVSRANKRSCCAAMSPCCRTVSTTGTTYARSTS